MGSRSDRSGREGPTAAEDGVYAAGNAPDLGLLVHTLEHGRIDVQYKPGTPAETVAQVVGCQATFLQFDGTLELALCERQ